MHRALLASATVLLLAGCSTMYDRDRYSEVRPYSMTRVGEEIDYELLDEVMFPTDSTALSDRALRAIGEIAAEARHHPGAAIVVDGYTDTVGTPEHNLELSRARALTVADVLVHEGVPRGRITIHGYGETHLAVPTPNQVKERRNRRVVIRLLPPL